MNSMAQLLANLGSFMQSVNVVQNQALAERVEHVSNELFNRFIAEAGLDNVVNGTGSRNSHRASNAQNNNSANASARNGNGAH